MDPQTRRVSPQVDHLPLEPHILNLTVEPLTPELIQREERRREKEIRIEEIEAQRALKRKPTSAPESTGTSSKQLKILRPQAKDSEESLDEKESLESPANATAPAAPNGVQTALVRLSSGKIVRVNLDFLKQCQQRQLEAAAKQKQEQEAAAAAKAAAAAAAKLQQQKLEQQQQQQKLLQQKQLLLQQQKQKQLELQQQQQEQLKQQQLKQQQQLISSQAQTTATASPVLKATVVSSGSLVSPSTTVLKADPTTLSKALERISPVVLKPPANLLPTHPAPQVVRMPLSQPVPLPQQPAPISCVTSPNFRPMAGGGVLVRPPAGSVTLANGGHLVPMSVAPNGIPQQRLIKFRTIPAGASRNGTVVSSSSSPSLQTVTSVAHQQQQRTTVMLPQQPQPKLSDQLNSIGPFQLIRGSSPQQLTGLPHRATLVQQRGSTNNGGGPVKVQYVQQVVTSNPSFINKIIVSSASPSSSAVNTLTAPAQPLITTTATGPDGLKLSVALNSVSQLQGQMKTLVTPMDKVLVLGPRGNVAQPFQLANGSGGGAATTQHIIQTSHSGAGVVPTTVYTSAAGVTNTVGNNVQLAPMFARKSSAAGGSVVVPASAIGGLKAGGVGQTQQFVIQQPLPQPQQGGQMIAVGGEGGKIRMVELLPHPSKPGGVVMNPGGKIVVAAAAPTGAPSLPGQVVGQQLIQQQQQPQPQIQGVIKRTS